MSLDLVSAQYHMFLDQINFLFVSNAVIFDQEEDHLTFRIRSVDFFLLTQQVPTPLPNVVPFHISKKKGQKWLQIMRMLIHTTF